MNEITQKPNPLRSYAIRLVVGFLCLLAVILLALYVAIGTPQGSAWILQKIASETGIALKYGKGNLRDGIWVSDIEIGKDSDVSVFINQGYVKMGFRAIFAGQIHIAKADVDTVKIINKNTPTGEPFDYPTLELPVNLWAENTTVKKVAYEQTGVTPFSLNNIQVESAKWLGSKITLTKGRLDVNDQVAIDEAAGQIDLSGNYPLNAVATVTVSGLDEHYIAPFKAKATGSLKRTVGEVSGFYNNEKVSGVAVVQALDEGVPFSAKLGFEKILIPYADSQAITLTDGTAVVAGTIDEMELRLNTDLTAKDVPTGHYTGRATLLPTKGMEIHTVMADTKDGRLTGAGKLDWQNDYFMTTEVASDNFKLKNAVPKEYKEYQDYLPELLQGKVGFDFGLKDNDNHQYYKIKLAQNNGETVFAHIRQKNGKDNNPYLIEANWQQLKRSNLPDIGKLNSPQGQVSLVVADTISLTGRASIDELAGLPKGEYDADLTINDKDMDIKTANYHGQAGRLTVAGQVYLPDDNRNLSYKINAQTDGIAPNTLLASDTPIQKLIGKFTLQGSLKTDNTPKNSTQIHDIMIGNADLTALLADKQSVQLQGDGTAVVTLQNSEIKHLTASYDGKVNSTNIHEAVKALEVSTKVHGNLNELTIDKLTASGDIGKLSAGGVIKLNDGIDWKVAVRSDELDLSKLATQANARLTGDIESVGRYKNGKLISATAKFNGKAVSDNLPSGDISLNAVGAGNKFTINALEYNGKAGKLSATGFLDMSKGLVFELIAKLNGFDIGYFVKDYKSSLTGELSAFANLQDTRQEFNIRHLDIQGKVNDEAVLAQGKLFAITDLPKNPKAFFNSLKKSSFDLDKLTKKGTLYDNLSAFGTKLKGDIANTDKRLRKVIESLTAERLTVIFGDNQARLDGNENRLSLDVNAKNLGQIVPTVRGQVVGGVILIGDENSLPTIYSDLSVSSVSMPSFAIREGSILAKIVNLGNEPSSLVVQGLNTIIAGKSFKKSRLDFNGTLQNHNLAAYLNDGELQVQGRLQGGLDDGNYQGVLSEGRMQTRYGVLNQLQPAQIAYDMDQGKVSAAAHCWQSVSANAKSVGDKGSLCLKQTLHASKEGGRVDMLIDNLDGTVFTPVLPSDLSFRAKLNGAVEATWEKDKTPVINAVLYSDNGEIGLRQEGLPDTTMGYQRLSVIAQTVPTGLKLRADVKAGKAGDGYVDIVIDPYQDDKPIAGALVLNRINLSILRPFFPAMQTLEGVVNVAGGVGGTLQQPQIFGNAILEEGKLSLADAPISLSDIGLTAQMRGTAMMVSGDFVSGKGKGQLAGEIDWQGEPQAKITLKGDELDILKPPLLTAKVSPDIQIITRPLAKFVDIKGVIAVPSATIRPPETSENVVGESPDVTVINRASNAKIDDILAKVEPWSINADIGVDLGDEVVFRGFGAKLPLAGALHITQQGQGAMRALGVVQVSERTMVDIFGQSLELNYGQIRFNGGDLTNPALSIMAARQIDGQTISLKVTGDVANPVISVFNDAGLSEQQAMNALVTGSLSEQSGTQVSEQNFRSQVTNNLAAAGLSLGLQGTRGITNDIGRALGLQSLVVDASGSSSDTNVNVTGYINPNLYIRYGVGVFNAESTLSMRYQLTRRVYVEATKATESIVDVVYRWRF